MPKIHIHLHRKTRDAAVPGKPSSFSEWMAEVKKDHPKAVIDGRFAYIGTKIVGEWEGKKGWVAPKKTRDSGRTYTGKSGRVYSAEELRRDRRTVHTGSASSKGYWHPDVGSFTLDSSKTRDDVSAEQRKQSLINSSKDMLGLIERRRGELFKKEGPTGKNYGKMHDIYWKFLGWRNRLGNKSLSHSELDEIEQRMNEAKQSYLSFKTGDACSCGGKCTKCRNN